MWLPRSGAPSVTTRPSRAGMRWFQHRANNDAAQTVSNEMHGVAGHALDEVRERFRVRLERLMDGGITESLHASRALRGGRRAIFAPGAHPQVWTVMTVVKP